jgi:aldehyde:ferredoxin oxidoreductase
MQKILRINMTAMSARYENVPDEFIGLGGRGLSSSIVSKEVDPRCEPLGPENKLVFAPGTLTGTSCPNSGRISVGAKSPLTGGIKESNSGGECPAKIARIGLTALVIEGQARVEEMHLLVLRKERAALLPCDFLKNMGTYEVSRRLKEKYGQRAGVICIGPAGEMHLSSASIQMTDRGGNPCRAAGRGGLGAVMGSKGLKAIVIDDTDGKSPLIVNKEMFLEGQKKLVKAIRNHPLTGKLMPTLGTTNILGLINAVGAFPAVNAKFGCYDKWEQISGEKLAEVIHERGGKVGHSACTNCIIRCSNVFVDKNRKYVTSGLEYETIYALGAMCDIADLDTIAKLDYLCDDLGVDTINTGVAVAVAMEAEIKSFGDKAGTLELVEEIGKGSEIGKLIGQGPVAVGKRYGVKRIPAVKNQAIPGYDPRGIQGMGITYATSNMGADHTDSWVVGANLVAIEGKLNPHLPKGQIGCFKEIQIVTAAMDSTGLCNFVNSPVADDPVGAEALLALVNGKYGTELDLGFIEALGKKIVSIERNFNVGAGWEKSLNRLPEFYYREALPPHNTTFLVSDEDLDSVYEI